MTTVEHEIEPVEGDAVGSAAPVVWVRPGSNVQGMATMVVSSIAHETRVTLRAIGAGAVNQAIKAAIQARQQLAAQGEDMVVRPGFTNVKGNEGEPVTAVVLHCVLI